MNHRTTLLPASLGLLAVAGSAAASPPETIELRGMIRDFHSSHVDFGVTPDQGYGHYPGNVLFTPDVEGTPILAGAGFKCYGQWRDVDANPIAPHMYIEKFEPGTVELTNSPSISGDVDTWDSSAGPYGGGNVGPAPTYVIGASMPDILVPTGLGPSQGDVTLNSGTLDADGHYNSLLIDGDLVVTGHRTILCDQDFTLYTHGKVVLQPGATLQLYVGGAIVFMPHSRFNSHPNSGMPQNATIYNFGTQELRISQPNGEVYAQVVAPDADLRIMPTGSLYGNYKGKNLFVMSNAFLHVDTGAIPTTLCGDVVEDEIGVAGPGSLGGIDSAASFAQWYDDVAGVNQSMHHGITLVRQPSGVYTYEDDQFFPIDDALMGNEGQAHNHHFTFQIDADFVYASCVNQYIEFEGADDFWLFIDDKLVIDLGGVNPGIDQRVDLDRLGLTDGETYTVRMCFAQRSGLASVFRLRTTIEDMWTPAMFLVSSAFD